MRLFILALGLFVPLALGCGSSDSSGPRRHPVSGTVTLDGKPLEHGQIIFDSVEDAAQGVPPTLAEIENGQYSLTTTPGDKTVKISQRVETGRDPITNEPVMKEMIPAKFNAKSELKTVVSDGENTANFDL